MWKPIFSQAKKEKKRIVLAEGEENRVLHATQELVTLGLATPILIGRPSVIEMRIYRLAITGHSLPLLSPFLHVNQTHFCRFQNVQNSYPLCRKSDQPIFNQTQKSIRDNQTTCT